MAYNTSTSATDINRCESYAQHVRVEQTCTTKRVYCLTQLVLCLSLMGVASPSLFVSKKRKRKKEKAYYYYYYCYYYYYITEVFETIIIFHINTIFK